jgi:hypothetical protein
MRFADAMRWLMIVALLAVFLLAGPMGATALADAAMMVLSTVLIVGLLLLIGSIRTARAAHTGAILLSLGRREEAQQELVGVLKKFSVFRSTLLVACQQLGTLLRAQGNHAAAREVFRSVLRYSRGWSGGMPSFHTTARLMLADAELALGDLPGAYEAFRPVYGSVLSVQDRLLLLPIELRYVLAAGHTGEAVAGLREKVRFAELLDAPQAAWVHMLLAEACEREGMGRESAFLRRRAELYHDLAELPTSPTTGGPGMVEGVAE